LPEVASIDTRLATVVPAPGLLSISSAAPWRQMELEKSSEVLVEREKSMQRAE
jgi:hypothetical protein